MISKVSAASRRGLARSLLLELLCGIQRRAGGANMRIGYHGDGKRAHHGRHRSLVVKRFDERRRRFFRKILGSDSAHKKHAADREAREREIAADAAVQSYE